MIGRLLEGKKSIVSVRPTSIVGEIVELLHHHRIGAVLVVEEDRIHGLVSERDIIRALHIHGCTILDQPAHAVMSSPVVTAAPGDSLHAAMSVMTDRRFRHLPVVESGRILGLVSIGDLVKARIAEAEAEASALKDYITS